VRPRAVLLLASAVILSGCLGSEAASDADPPASPQLVSAATPERMCPLTLPNGNQPPADHDVGANHGNGVLWTAMWPHNVVIATPDYFDEHGAVVMKWGWWRGVAGELRITGRRLDGKAPQLTAGVPGGYGRRGFQPTGISFPTEGCWEVTGAVGDAKLTFVTLVLKAERYWPLPEAG
jgi:hypothetical protein